MNWIRDFSSEVPQAPHLRDLEDAPAAMRQELVDAVYLVASQTHGQLDADHDLYFVIIQSLGFEAAGNPAAGRRQRIGRDIACADWTRVYDVIARLWREFERVGSQEDYRLAVNPILAAYRVAWDLGEDGHLHRVLPVDAQAQVARAFAELDDPRYAAALALFNAARDAYDDRPRRDRDACANAFDALESVAKEKCGMPQEVFKGVVTQLRRTQTFNTEILEVLEKLNALRNRNFGHGMVTPFNLSAAEVDFTYLACVAGILLFARVP